MRRRFVTLDVFTERRYTGNPLAVFPDGEGLTDEQMQQIAREMNLSETAFLRHREGCEYELRWFTPKVEVALCGHATLASAHFLYESGGVGTNQPITFSTRKSGPQARGSPGPM